jgi:ethanolamine utilization protein EutA
MSEDEGGRIFFSSKGRTLEGEDEIVILSVGVDIGSSTSHLVFSRIVLERLDSRYVVSQRETFYESDILLTPYTEEETIDSEKLGAFIAKQYEFAKVQPDEIDTGRSDSHRRRCAAQKRPHDRRSLRQPNRQAGGGQRRR